MIADRPLERRRHDLDWLRVIAFGFLILYHIGMFYVTWDWHVKSPFAAQALEPFMRLISPWRLPILFFISGVALKFAADKQPSAGLLQQRLVRLGLPLVFGVVVWVVPQAYYELLAKRETSADYLAFWWNYLDVDVEFSIITPTYNHLWYVVYILLYTLILVPLRPALEWLRRPFDRLWSRGGAMPILLLPLVPFVAYRAVLGDAFPVTHALVDDWFNHANALTFVVFGYLAGKSAPFWRAIDRVRQVALALAVTLGSLRLLSSLSQVSATGVWAALQALAGITYGWAVIVSLLGHAQRHLDRSSPVLRYLGAAVFPYYILHQTLIVCLGAWASGLPLWAEVAVVSLGTLAGCALGYEIVRRVALLRPLFGLPWRSGGTGPLPPVAKGSVPGKAPLQRET